MTTASTALNEALVPLPRLKCPLRRTVLEEWVHVNFSAGDLRLLLVATRVTRPPSEGEVHQACTSSGAVPCRESSITHRSIRVCQIPPLLGGHVQKSLRDIPLIPFSLSRACSWGSHAVFRTCRCLIVPRVYTQGGSAPRGSNVDTMGGYSDVERQATTTRQRYECIPHWSEVPTGPPGDE